MKAYTDGACKGNPGIGGWGLVIVRDGEALHEAFGHEAQTTNNRMELQAVVEALKLQHLGISTIYSDSTYVCKGINEWMSGWKRKGWVTSTGSAVKNADLWKLIDSLWNTKLSIVWVKGHSTNKWNNHADLLANKGARNEDPETDM